MRMRITRSTAQFSLLALVAGAGIAVLPAGGPASAQSGPLGSPPTGVAMVTTVAGNGTYSLTGAQNYGGDGGPAVLAQLEDPSATAFNSAGDMFIADEGNDRIREVNTAGIISTFAGTGTAGETGDGGPAVDAELENAYYLVVNSSGDVFVSDWASPGPDEPPVSEVREINTSGIINTIATLGGVVLGMAIAPDGDIYVTVENLGLYEINTDDQTTLLTASLGGSAQCADGPATNSPIESIAVCGGTVATDSAGNVYFWDDTLLEKFNPASGLVVTIAGDADLGNMNDSGDGGPALDASFTGNEEGIAVDSLGDIYVSDIKFATDSQGGYSYGVIRMINRAGTVDQVAGAPGRTFTGPDGPALETTLGGGSLIAGPPGDLYFTEPGRIREITGLSTSDCGCATGPFANPDVENLAQTAVSPNGAFDVATSQQGDTDFTFTITNAVTAAVVATISLPTSATVAASGGWGFGPDGNSFVVQYDWDGTDYIQLYDLTGPNPGDAAWSAGEANAEGSVGFSPDGHYLVAVQYAATTNQASLAIVSTLAPLTGSIEPDYQSTFTIAAAPGEGDDTVDSANWGFSQTSSSFVYQAVNNSGVATLTLVSLPTGQQMSIQLTDATPSFVRFSPCGDLLGVVAQQGFEPTLLEATLYSTTKLESVASQQIANGDVTLESTPTEILATVLTSSGTLTTTLAPDNGTTNCVSVSSATAGGSPPGSGTKRLARQPGDTGHSAVHPDSASAVTMTLPNFRGQVSLPADVTPAASTFTYTETDDLTSYPVQGEVFAGLAFTLTATGSAGKPVTTLADSYTDAINVTPADLAAMGITDPTTLGLYWWSGSAWTSVEPCSPCSVDTTSDVLTATTSQLGTFAVMAPEPTVALPAVSGSALEATAGSAVTATVATITPAGSEQAADDYWAVIDWGDGTQSPGLISQSATGLAVSGTHTYAGGGTFTVTIGVNELGGLSPVTATTTATVSGAPAASAPEAPTGVSAIGGSSQATVSFTAPADDGGSSITSYTVTAADESTPANGGQTATGTASPITLTGLISGDTYTFSVTATNAVGTGPASAPSDPVMLGHVPGDPAPAPPAAVLGKAYKAVFAASGSPAATFTVTAGSLPPGLVLSAAGALAGTPTEPGSYVFTVTAANAAGSASARFTVPVRPAFAGFVSPHPRQGIAGTNKRIAVSFRLGSFTGKLLATASARAVVSRVSLSTHASGQSPASTATCRYQTRTQRYLCELKLPGHAAKAGTRYYLSAYVDIGGSFVLVPLARTSPTGNPEVVLIR